MSAAGQLALYNRIKDINPKAAAAIDAVYNFPKEKAPVEEVEEVEEVKEAPKKKGKK